MSKEKEPAKLLLPYLQRADELQNHDPLLSYYCRLYAMESGLKFPQSERTKTTNSLLISLMKQLEKDKKSLKLGPDDQLHLEGFALNVFEKADKQDRAGRGNLNTAKTFYAASIFFEILNQFGDIQPDLEQKQKYAAWKAADIRKAIKEGRTPVAGPPGGEENFSILASTSSGEYDVEPSQPDPAIKSAPLHPSPQFYDEVPPRQTSDIPPSSSNNSPPSPPHFPSPNHPSHDIQPSQSNRSEDTSYPQMYHHQPYPQEPHQHVPQNYPSHEDPTHPFPNFQSYPSFTESSLPTGPSQYPSNYQGSDSSYPTSDPAQFNSLRSFKAPHNEPAKAPTVSNQHLHTEGDSSGRNGSVPVPMQSYQYDSNYQPAPEKIAEAHKAARFAVGALAFDDVPTAVSFLKKSLELLMNPAADH